MNETAVPVVEFPRIIQGGMGVGISGWRLANAVSSVGQLGVVSGTGIDAVLVRSLFVGDPGGHYRRALEAFPFQEISTRILRAYFRQSPSSGAVPFPRLPLLGDRLIKEREEVLVLANFAEVYLAKQGHSGEVGINFLEKIQAAMLPSLYGAILAGVDYVLIGAGIPREIPGAIDLLAKHSDASLRLNVAGAASTDDYRLYFSPKTLIGERSVSPLRRPRFLGIVSSSALAVTLAKKASGKVDGFIIEAPTAGGHNAPPRGEQKQNDRGEPVYGERDAVDLNVFRSLSLPFWLAGAYASEYALRRALAEGAQGIQLGTVFALSRESGMESNLRARVLKEISEDSIDIFTDSRASPTGFPFKIAKLSETLSESDVYAARDRICDIGYLRQAYKKEDGSVGWRCSGEPESIYEGKGGQISETLGRKCLCNALLATIGLGQVQAKGKVERPIVTLGDDVKSLLRFNRNYSAKEVVEKILSEI